MGSDWNPNSMWQLGVQIYGVQNIYRLANLRNEKCIAAGRRLAAAYLVRCDMHYIIAHTCSSQICTTSPIWTVDRCLWKITFQWHGEHKLEWYKKPLLIHQITVHKITSPKHALHYFNVLKTFKVAWPLFTGNAEALQNKYMQIHWPVPKFIRNQEGGMVL